jgi:V8-like Glu-specific endopeptidase
MIRFILFTTLWASVASAYPRLSPNLSLQTQSTNFSSLFTANHNFEGIVGLSNCSGSLVQFETSRDTDPGMVLTNGHCAEQGFPKPGQIYYGLASQRRFTVLDRNAGSIGKVTANLLMYSTMTKTDVTLYRLNESIGEIKRKFGFAPLTISSQHPAQGQNIEVISGYWRRGFRCSVERFVYKLREGGWIDEDSIKYSDPGCEVYGGTSGSPIVAEGSRTVIGINNTGNESGESCTENNPCEIDQSGQISQKKGWSYGQQTYWITTCLNANLELDLNTRGCLLPK